MASPFLFFVLVFVQSSWGASRPTTIHRQDGSSSSSGAVQPEAPFVCVQPGFFGDLTDCTRFYRCVDFFGTGERFTLFTFVCGEGTIFDESLSVCNHPSWVSPPPACLSGNASSSAGVTPGSSLESSTASPPCPPSSTDGTSTSATGIVSESSTAPAPGGSESTAPPQPTSAPSIPSNPSPSEGSSTEPSVPSSPSSPVDPSISSSSTSPIESSNQSLEPSPATPGISSPSSESTTSAPSPVSQPVVPGPFTLICGDQRYHRHPLRCDLYYQCVWTELSFSIDLKACPSGLIYDEASSNCVPPAKTVACQIAPGSASTVAPETISPGSTAAPEVSSSAPSVSVSPESTATPVEVSTSSPQYTLAPGSLYNCPRPGHFPYQLDCIRFYRCFEIEPQVLKGLLYRCPPGYGYSTVTERCQKQETLPACNRPGTRLPTDFPIPFIPLEDTTMVRLEDLDRFFSNPNYFYQPRQYRIGSFQPILPPQFYYGY